MWVTITKLAVSTSMTVMPTTCLSVATASAPVVELPQSELDTHVKKSFPYQTNFMSLL